MLHLKAHGVGPKSKKAKSLARLRPLPSELSKTWLRPQITILLSRNNSEPLGDPHVPRLSASHLVRAFALPQGMARIARAKPCLAGRLHREVGTQCHHPRALIITACSTAATPRSMERSSILRNNGAQEHTLQSIPDHRLSGKLLQITAPKGMRCFRKANPRSWPGIPLGVKNVRRMTKLASDSRVQTKTRVQ